MNLIKTAMLMAFMTALFMTVGFAIGGRTGMMMALLFAAGTNLYTWWGSDKAVLSMNRAVEVDAQSAPEYFAIVQALAQRANLPMPTPYIIENDQPNAFATGRSPNHAAVAVTTGLLKRLSAEEASGVIAHELAHVRNRDTLIMTVTATFAGAISMLGNFAFIFGGSRNRNNPLGGFGSIIAVMLAPFAAMIVQMAISRTREYSADRLGAQICGHPLWLASALKKLEASHTVNQDAERNPATAHMFIVNPLSGLRMDGLFSTHPSTETRVAKLETLAIEMDQEANNEKPVLMNEAPMQPTNSGSGPWGRNPS